MNRVTEEDLDFRERRRQALALIELQAEVLKKAIALYKAEESVERMPPQPERGMSARVVPIQKAAG